MKFTLIKNTSNHQLITIKALKAINEAQFIIADPYTDNKIFDIASTKATIYRKEEKTTISDIVDAEKPRNKIVQLTEECSSTRNNELDSLDYFKKLGYETNIIPGISNINGITGRNHFPLTIRGRNESFWVYDCKNHLTHNLSLHQQIATISNSHATIVITNPNEQLKTVLNLISRYRCSSTAVLLCARDNTYISTSIKHLLNRIPHHLDMVVINPDSGNSELTIQANTTESTMVLQTALLAV